MNALVSIAGVIAILCVAAGLLGLADRRNFAPRWLLAALGLVLLNDALLTNLYGLLPDVVGGNWNWQGKLLALLASLAVAASPAFGLRAVGVTSRQAPGSMRAAIPVAVLYVLFFLAIALAFPGEGATAEDAAFQLTMPGLEEELFYRGLLLVAFDRALRGRKRFLGVEWGWGAILSSLAFGLAHAFGISDGSVSLDWMTLGLTAIPSLLAVWLVYRTGSLLLPVLLHNFGNSIGLFI
ncbi:CPBP family intramembrane glutamic endopeptidase, BDIM_20840 family [Tsuneonella sp. HG222]